MPGRFSKDLAPGILVDSAKPTPRSHSRDLLVDGRNIIGIGELLSVDVSSHGGFADDIESAQGDVRVHVERPLTGMSVQLLHEHFRLLVEDFDEIFQDVVVECWSQKFATWAPFLGVAETKTIGLEGLGFITVP